MKYSFITRALMVFFVGLTLQASAVSPAPIVLGNADGYSVLAGSGINNTGNSSFTGYVGSYPTTTVIQGSGSWAESCTAHDAPGDPYTIQAKADLRNAYDTNYLLPSTTIPTELGGQLYTTGVYSLATGLQLTSGILTLDGGNDPNAVFIFIAGSTLDVAAGGSFNLINQAKAKNVFFIVGSTATLTAGSVFVGTIIAQTDINLVTGTTIDGRILAIDGAVSMDTNSVNTTSSEAVPCAGTPTPTPTPTFTATATPSPTPSPTPTGTPSTFTPSPTPPAVPAPPGDTYIYPSPTRGDTATAVYYLKEAGDATLNFYNQTGRLVDVIREPKPAGWQSSPVSVGRFSAGTYYYVVSASYASGSSESQTPRKFVVLH
jgi:hypothetical protein